MITFDIPLLTILGVVINVLLPLLVGLVTTRTTDPGRKAILLAVLSLLLQLATELAAALQQSEPYNLGLGLLMGLVGFALAVSAHYGIYRPTGLTDSAQAHLRTADTIPGELADDTITARRAGGSISMRAAPDGSIIKNGRLDAGGPLPSGTRHVVNNTGKPERIIPASELDDDGPDHRKPGPAI